MTRFTALIVACLIAITGIVFAETRSDYNRNGFMVFFDDVAGDTLQVLAPNVFQDDFTGDTLATDSWLATVDGAGTSVISGATSYNLITTDTGATDKVEVATGLFALASKNPSVEARAYMGDVLHTTMFIGLTDARFEGANTLSFALSGASLTSTATDAVGFLWDSAQTAATVKCVSVKNNVDGTVINSGIALTNAVFKTFRVDVDSLGNATFWIDGASVCSQSLAVTVTAPLAGVMGLKNQEGSANTMVVDRFKLWQGK